MKKRIVPILLVIALIFVFVVSASAEITGNVYDEAGLLDSSEVTELQTKCEQIKAEYGITPYIIFLNTINYEDIDVYSREYIVDQGLDEKCIVFMIAMDSRDVTVIASDTISTYIGTTEREDVYKYLYGDLTDGEYYDSATKFLEAVEHYLNPDTASTGAMYQEVKQPPQYFSFKWIVISLAVGFIVAFLIANGKKKELKTVVAQRGASEYVKPGSFNLTSQSDRFLYFHVTRVKKPKDNNKGGFGGMHSSSGGGFSSTSGKF